MGGGGGRASNNGGMGSRGSSTGSRGGSRGSSSASPGRSTPGSPNAADGRRGSSMGASGGSARDASNATTNPGRPGGEADQRALANDISRLQSQRDSLSSELSGIDTQLNDRRQKLSRLSENLQGVESTLSQKRNRLSSLTDNLQGVESQLNTRRDRLGSLTNNLQGVESTLSQKRNRLSSLTDNLQGVESQLSTGRDRLSGLNSEIGRIQREANNARNRMVASPDNFRERKALDRSLEGDDNTMAGLIAPAINNQNEGIDPTTEGYAAIVGDGELTNSERVRQAEMGQLDSLPNADVIGFNQDRQDLATGRFQDRTKMPGVGVFQGLGAIARNSFMARDVANEANDMAAERNLDVGALQTDAGDLAAAYNSASLSETTGGLLGNAMAPGMAAVGDYSAPAPNAPRGGDSSSSGLEEEPPPPAPRVEGPQPQPPAAGNSRYGGRLTNYGSYRRRFRRALAPRV